MIARSTPLALHASFAIIMLGIVDFAYAQSGAVAASTGLLQIFLALAVVIGIMLLLAWIVKRVGPIGNNQQLPVKIIGGTTVGNRERVMVIEVADQWLVIGVTSQQINVLSTMPKQDIPANSHPTTNVSVPFADWLKKTIDKGASPNP
ncbi:flagellar biosynthetic protein FliO [Undibacterium fentianense]|uniref:Flagellar protein n=1 Tax=Undibacterium fentianense TaxID=2828728 RepID=A0A941IBD8_9BURK|nr:flagellar biosynthetic protein FliO [Undibacterium fentianense]MBR7798949.1 flagellar biosynthetic protein FliO [Undibacterium fentianense]